MRHGLGFTPSYYPGPTTPAYSVGAQISSTTGQLVTSAAYPVTGFFSGAIQGLGPLGVMLGAGIIVITLLNAREG